jgi:hypothetical protein
MPTAAVPRVALFQRLRIAQAAQHEGPLLTCIIAHFDDEAAALVR